MLLSCRELINKTGKFNESGNYYKHVSDKLLVSLTNNNYIME